MATGMALDMVEHAIRQTEAQIRRTAVDLRAQEERLVDALQRGASDAVVAIIKERVQDLKEDKRYMKSEKRSYRLLRSTLLARARHAEANIFMQSEGQRAAAEAGAALQGKCSTALAVQSHLAGCATLLVKQPSA